MTPGDILLFCHKRVWVFVTDWSKMIRINKINKNDLTIFTSDQVFTIRISGQF